MRSRRHRGSESHDHGIDLAPMLDFVLNLLIFFIITTSFVRETGINVNREEAFTAISASARVTVTPGSFTKEVVMMKKISRFSTKSSIGARSMPVASSWSKCLRSRIARS